MASREAFPPVPGAVAPAATIMVPDGEESEPPDDAEYVLNRADEKQLGKKKVRVDADVEQGLRGPGEAFPRLTADAVLELADGREKGDAASRAATSNNCCRQTSAEMCALFRLHVLLHLVKCMHQKATNHRLSAIYR